MSQKQIVLPFPTAHSFPVNCLTRWRAVRRRVRACRRAAPSQSQVGTTFILRTRNRNPPINPTHSSGFYLIHLPPSKRKSFNWLILLNLASYQTNERWMVGRYFLFSLDGDKLSVFVLSYRLKNPWTRLCTGMKTDLLIWIWVRTYCRINQ